VNIRIALDWIRSGNMDPCPIQGCLLEDLQRFFTCLQRANTAPSRRTSRYIFGCSTEPCHGASRRTERVDNSDSHASIRRCGSTDIWFPALRCRCRIRSRIRFRSRFRNRFRKNRVRTCRLCRCCGGVCAAIARQAQEAGRRVSRAKEWAQLQARTNGRYGKIELDPMLAMLC